jgi:hypothetical protein
MNCIFHFKLSNSKWVNLLPRQNKNFSEVNNKLDQDSELKIISEKKKYNSGTKYYLITIIFICGLLLVSMVKNETRNLQKKINNLKTSINLINFDLDQAVLDNQVIKSPENISLLAKEHLSINLKAYKRFQIINSNFNQFPIEEKKEVNIKKPTSLQSGIKNQVAKQIEINKTKVIEIQKFYSNPKMIPMKIKTKISLSVEEKKSEIKDIINKPHDIFTLKKVAKWSAIQVAKLFLGMPVVPGK